jgi:hypothetical protein
MRARLLTFVSAMRRSSRSCFPGARGCRRAGGRAARRRPQPGAIPRMPDGKPDLQGTYDIGTLTPLQRTAGTRWC